MEMHQVRYFLALAEDLNFTRAAARCNVSQPSLTRAIKLLEAELGGPLLRRERTNTRLTELGEMMLPHLREISLQADAAKSAATKLKAVAHKRLRLGVMCTIAPEPTLALVRAMSHRHPDVELEVTDSTAALLENMLKAGKLDIALYCLPDVKDDGLHYHPLFRERMVIVLHPDSPLAALPRMRLADLKNERYLNRINCEYNGCLDLNPSDMVWNKVYRSERDDWILAMVADGMGFSLLPAFSVTRKDLVVRPLAEPELWRRVDVVTVRGRPHSAAVGALVREAMRNSWDTRTPKPEA